jgi:Tfp pilus assembly protein PilF
MLLMKRIVLIALSCSLFFAAGAGAQSVTRGTFVVIQKVQELMSEERYEEAIVELEALVIKVADNPYDFALANQYLAHTSVLMDNSARARSALEAALGNPDIPQEIRTSMNLFYGTIMLGQEEFELALNALEEWFSLATVPQPGQIFSLAYANYRNDNVPRAEELVARAIDDSPDPQNTWYQLYYRVLFEQKKYEQAEVVLKGIITREPKEESNWRLLASHYLQIEDSREGLAAMMIAYINEFLETNSDLKQIVSLWGYIDAPEKGARLLEEWLDSGKLETDAESLKQLGNLWLMARERDNALSALSESAKLAPDGKTYELLGGIYFEDEQWASAYTNYQNALDQGELEEPSRVSLLAGIAAYRAGNNENAKRALEIAAEDEELAAQAESILRELR